MKFERVSPDPNEENARPLGAELRLLGNSLADIVRSEIRLAKAEARSTLGKVTRDSGIAIAFGAFAALGILPLIAFLVIGLGELLNGRYWLSSLVVACGMFAIGGGVAYLFYRRLRSEDLTLAATRESLERPLGTIDHELHRLGDFARNNLSNKDNQDTRRIA